MRLIRLKLNGRVDQLVINIDQIQAAYRGDDASSYMLIGGEEFLVDEPLEAVVQKMTEVTDE